MSDLRASPSTRIRPLARPSVLDVGSWCGTPAPGGPWRHPECHNGPVLDAGLRDEVERLAKAFEPELVDVRRDLHMHPELGHAEHRTTAAIVGRLTEAGLWPR